MSILKIYKYPEPVLAKKAARVEAFGPDMLKLFDDMIETMYVSDGVGLAAPQIGVSKQIFVMCPTRVPGEEYIVINPVIESSSGKELGLEGCLSLPGISAEVPRATKLKLTYQDQHGKKHTLQAESFFARVIQHEIDHLNGMLIVDRFSFDKRRELLAQYEAAKNRPRPL